MIRLSGSVTSRYAFSSSTLGDQVGGRPRWGEAGRGTGGGLRLRLGFAFQRIQQQRGHHDRVIRRESALLRIGLQDRGEVQRIPDRVPDEVGQMPSPVPVPEPRTATTPADRRTTVYIVCSCALQTIWPGVCPHKNAGLFGQTPRLSYVAYWSCGTWEVIDLSTNRIYTDPPRGGLRVQSRTGDGDLSGRKSRL